jgi:hypothetical protein
VRRGLNTRWCPSDRRAYLKFLALNFRKEYDLRRRTTAFQWFMPPMAVLRFVPDHFEV